MSTAGKVLVVLVALVMVVWIILFSMIGQLNSTWGAKVEALKQEQEKLQPKVEQEETRLAQVLNDIKAVQDDKIQKTRVLQTEVEDREGLLARTREALSAAQIRLAKVNAAVETAKANRDLRIMEKAGTEKSLAAQRSAVEQIQAENTDLLAKLSRLRDEFKRTLDENKQLLRRVAQAGPQVRPASFITP